MSARSNARVRRIGGLTAAAVVIAATLGSSSLASAAPTTVPPAAEPVAEAPAKPSHLLRTEGPASWRETATAASTQRRPSRAAARQAVAVRQAAFTAFTTKSKATRDMRGVEKSLYRGKYFNATAEAKRLCVVERESEGHYDVVNPGGSYFGAYQVSRDLARGATWMMLKEHKKLMGKAAAKKVLGNLRNKPMNTWPRYWQDAAFHTVANYHGTLSGIKHWAGGRWHC